MKIYLAAPLFNPRELEWNAKICKMLEESGHEVFLPQRDGGKSAELMAQAKTLQELEMARQGIFKKDFEAVCDSDLCVFVTDGIVMDVGACAEIGMFYYAKKPVIALHQDTRSFIQGRINLFVEGCISVQVSSLEELLSELKKPL